MIALPSLPTISSWWTIGSGALGILIGNVIRPIHKHRVRKARHAADMATIVPVAPDIGDWVQPRSFELEPGEFVQLIGFPMKVVNGSKETVTNVRFGVREPGHQSEASYPGYAEVLPPGKDVPGMAWHLVPASAVNSSLLGQLVFFARFQDPVKDWETVLTGSPLQCSTQPLKAGS